MAIGYLSASWQIRLYAGVYSSRNLVCQKTYILMISILVESIITFNGWYCNYNLVVVAEEGMLETGFWLSC